MKFVDFSLSFYSSSVFLLSICLIPLLDIMFSFLWSSEFVAFIFVLISSSTAHALQARGQWTKCRPCNYSASSSWWLAAFFSPCLPPNRNSPRCYMLFSFILCWKKVLQERDRKKRRIQANWCAPTSDTVSHTVQGYCRLTVLFCRGS